MTKEAEVVVAQYAWLKKASDRIRGGEMCVFHTVQVDASVVVVLQRGPVDMPAVLRVAEVSF